MLCLKLPENMEQDDKIPLQGKQPCAPEEKLSWASPEPPKGNTRYLWPLGELSTQ